MKFAIAVGAMLLTACAQLGRSETPPRRVEIEAKRFTYTPSEITLKKGEPVVLVFHTADVEHGFKLAEMNIKVNIKKNKDTEVSFTPTEVGHFVGKCAHFCGKGHGKMILQIDVIE
jgi:cytochrome c oxidase subunit 2